MTDPIRAALSADGPAVPEGREPSDVDVLRVAAHALGYLSTPPWDFEAAPMSADDVLTIARAAIALDRSHRATAPPAEGDVTDGELNAMWNCSGISDEYGNHTGNIFEFARAAIAFDRTRRALAKSEPAGPSDIELLSMAGNAVGHEIALGEYEPETECVVEAYGSELIDFARAVLARWGHQPAPPVEGEVGELVDSLRRASDGASAMGWEQDSWIIARAADLLEQRQAAPVLGAEPPLYARQTGTGQWEGADHPSGPWRKVLPADLAHWLPATPKPNIVPKPQFPSHRVIPGDFP